MRARALGVFVAILGLLACVQGPLALEACPNSGNAGNLVADQTLICHCGAAPNWHVYGTDRYTGDSGLCDAAVHAGVIPPSGGDVTAYGGTGCASYMASTRNGVASLANGRYASSFGFTDPLAPCPEAAQDDVMTAQLARDCQARGRDATYCACESKALAAKIGGSGVALLQALNAELHKEQKVPLLAAAIAKLLSDNGVNLASLPSLKDSVGEVRAAVVEACGS